MFNETQATSATTAPTMTAEMQIIDSQQQLRNIKRLLNREIKGVELTVSEAVRDTLLIQAACLETGLVSAGAEEAVMKVNELVKMVRRLAGVQ